MQCSPKTACISKDCVRISGWTVIRGHSLRKAHSFSTGLGGLYRLRIKQQDAQHLSVQLPTSWVGYCNPCQQHAPNWAAMPQKALCRG